MHSKAVYFVIPLLILVSGFSLMRNQAPSSAMELQRFGSNIRVMSLEAPSYVEFAGERIPSERIEVKAKIDTELKRYTRGLNGSSVLLKRTGRYRESFTRTLADHGVPADFFFLSMIESNLSNAVSPVGAVGFWQLMPETARRYGLEVSEHVDERLNIEKATLAAARYLRDLHKEFDSWILVAAAYNRGGAGMQRAVDKQDNSDYFSLHLNKETARYVYRAIAIKLLVNSPENFGFELPKTYKPIHAYSTEIKTSIQNIPLYILNNDLDPRSFRQLNPWILNEYLEVEEGETYTLQLPMGNIHAPEMELAGRYFDLTIAN